MPALRTVLVPIGELRVSSDPGEVLTTCAGSCVAVALRDREAAVGGLLHVVLPGRRGSAPSARSDYPGVPATYYADPGVVLLINEVLGRGARRENLVADLAGGASLLPGEASEDAVGTRNVRRVVEVLAGQGIPIRSQDVGGREGRRLALRVGTGEVEVSRTARSSPSSPEPTPAPAPGRLRELAENLSGLGPNPAVAGALLDEVHRATVDWVAVGEVVARDFVLALQILRLGNSAAYGRPREVTSLESGLQLLGPAQLRRICVLAATARNAEFSLADVRGLEPLLRRHCQASALVAARLAGRLPASFRSDAFAASLLHGLGEIAARICATMQPRGETSEADAPGLGALVLSQWRFPERMVEAARLHGRAEERTDEEPSLASLSGAACAVAHLLGVPCVSDPLGPPDSVFARLGAGGAADGGISEIHRDLQSAGLLDDA